MEAMSVFLQDETLPEDSTFAVTRICTGAATNE